MEENKAIFSGENLFDSKPSEAGLENCFTCFRKTEDYLRITESDSVTGDNLEAVFAQHFWFTRNEYYNQTVCKSCWERIDDFHRFYCEVEKAYAPPPALVEIKTELEDDEDVNRYDEGGGDEESETNDGAETRGVDFDDTSNEDDDGMVYAEPLCTLVEGKNVPTRRKRKPTGATNSNVPLTKRKSSKIKPSDTQHTPEEDQKHFKCTICPKAFAEQDMLNSHISWHQEIQQKNHHCTICDRYFYSAGFLETHMQQQHEPSDSVPSAKKHNDPEESEAEPGDEGANQDMNRGTPEEIARQEELIHKFVTMSCPQCEYVAETFVDFRRHGRVEHGLSSASVNCCHKKFHKRFRLYEHCLTHANPDHFKCDLCDKVFRDSAGVQHHKWFIHTPMSERPFKCDVCGEAFVKGYQLKTHMGRHMDREQKRHYCEQCNRAFSTGVLLKNHMQRMHGQVSEWVCDVCAKQFSHRGLLKRHRMTHTKEGLTQIMKQCERCGKWLADQKTYTQHKRRLCEFNEPVKCTECDYEARSVSALDQHKRMKHQERRVYPCSYCGKEFNRELRLKEHEANHAGILLYKCPHCPRTCNSSSNMYTHKKVAHPEQWAVEAARKNASPTERYNLMQQMNN